MGREADGLDGWRALETISPGVPKVYCTVHAIRFKLRHAGATPLTGVQPHPMIVVGLSLDFFAIHDRNSSGFD